MARRAAAGGSCPIAGKSNSLSAYGLRQPSADQDNRQLPLLAEEDIRSERLVPLLDEHFAATEGFYLYYPERAPIPRKLQTFVEFMQAANVDAEAATGHSQATPVVGWSS